MIKSHLSKIMGERRVRISVLAREIGVHRNSITLLYEDKATRVELETLSRLCKYFDCKIEDLLEYRPVPLDEKKESETSK